jgi:hypothetical protein
MEDMARWMVPAGVALVVGGLLLWGAARLGLPLGRLPGDIKVNTDGSTFYFPVVTCIILSIVLTLLLSLAARLLGR